MPSRQGWIAPSDPNAAIRGAITPAQQGANRPGAANRLRMLSVDLPAFPELHPAPRERD